MRESNYWLRVITVTQLNGFKEVGHLVHESHELVSILATIHPPDVRKREEGKNPITNSRWRITNRIFRYSLFVIVIRYSLFNDHILPSARPRNECT